MGRQHRVEDTDNKLRANKSNQTGTKLVKEQKAGVSSKETHGKNTPLDLERVSRISRTSGS